MTEVGLWALHCEKAEGWAVKARETVVGQPGPGGGSWGAQGQQLTWTRPGWPRSPLSKQAAAVAATATVAADRMAHLETELASCLRHTHSSPLWLPFQGRALQRETKGAWPQNTEPVFLPLRGKPQTSEALWLQPRQTERAAVFR